MESKDSKDFHSTTLERSKKPAGIPISPLVAAPLVSFSSDNTKLIASLPRGDKVEVLLYGATVTSWKTGNGQEQLFLSNKAILDGSKPVRGGIPLVFPLFGPPQDSHAATSKLPQHGFARNSKWEYLGKNSSESLAAGKSSSDTSVTIDFGLGESQLDDKFKAAWPYSFSVTYSITLGPDELTTSLRVANAGDKPFEFQTLFHTYFATNDIATTQVSGLESNSFINKVPSPKETAAANEPVKFSGELDRVYTGASKDITINSGGKAIFTITRDGLPDVVVWNPWADKAKGMSDFGPEDGWKKMVCVEAGSVGGFVKLESGETWEALQIVKAHL